LTKKNVSSFAAGSTLPSSSHKLPDDSGLSPAIVHAIRLIIKEEMKERTLALLALSSNPAIPPQSPAEYPPIPPLEEVAPKSVPLQGIKALTERPGFQSSNWFNKDISLLAKQAKKFVHGDEPTNVQGASTDETKILKKIQLCFASIHKINKDEELNRDEKKTSQDFLENNGSTDKKLQDNYFYELELDPKKSRVQLLGECLKVNKYIKQQDKDKRQQSNRSGNFRGQGKKQREKKRTHWPGGTGAKQ